MKVLGIDPGINGACAIYGGAHPPRLFDLPVLGDEARKEIDVRALASIIRPWGVGHAFIENVFAMPSIPGADGVRRGMGAASAFKFGFAIGQIRATVALLGIPYTLVVPRVWMKRFGLTGSDKEAHRQVAIRLMPECADELQRKKDHQRAEALMIARYGWEKLNGGQDGGRTASGGDS